MSNKRRPPPDTTDGRPAPTKRSRGHPDVDSDKNLPSNNVYRCPNLECQKLFPSAQALHHHVWAPRKAGEETICLDAWNEIRRTAIQELLAEEARTRADAHARGVEEGLDGTIEHPEENVSLTQILPYPLLTGFSS